MIELTMADISEQLNEIIKSKNTSENFLMNGRITALNIGVMVQTEDSLPFLDDPDILDVLYTDYGTMILLNTMNSIIVYRKVNTKYEKTILVENVNMIKYVNMSDGWLSYVKYDNFELLIRAVEIVCPCLDVYKSTLTIFELNGVGNIIKMPYDTFSKTIFIEEKYLNKIINENIIYISEELVVVLSDEMVCYKIRRHNGTLSDMTKEKLSITGKVYLNDCFVVYNENNTIKIKNILSVFLDDIICEQPENLNYSDIKDIIICSYDVSETMILIIITEKTVFVFEHLENKDKFIPIKVLNLNKIKHEMIYYSQCTNIFHIYYFENDELCVATIDLKSMNEFGYRNIGIRKGDIKERPIVRRAKSARSVV